MSSNQFQEYKEIVIIYARYCMHWMQNLIHAQLQGNESILPPKYEQ